MFLTENAWPQACRLLNFKIAFNPRTPLNFITTLTDYFFN